VSYLQTQDGALKVTAEVLDRISELSTLYQDPTKNAADKLNYDAEFLQLKAQLTSNTTATFNGINLFQAGSITTQVSEDGTQTVTLTGKDLANAGTGVGTLIAGPVVSLASAGASLANITTAIQNVATMRANNGAEQSRLGFASELLTVNKSNLEAANSRIVDVDVAEESTQLARWNILVQSGTAMLAQANGSAQMALKLIQ
jgi:flagellin